MITEAEVLKKIAMAHGALFKLTKETLGDDQSDGIRMSRILEKHAELFRLICDEWRSYSQVTNEEIALAEHLAGFRP